VKTNSDPCNKNLSVARQKMHSSNVYTRIVTGNRLFLPQLVHLGGMHGSQELELGEV